MNNRLNVIWRRTRLVLAVMIAVGSIGSAISHGSSHWPSRPGDCSFLQANAQFLKSQLVKKQASLDPNFEPYPKLRLDGDNRRTQAEIYQLKLLAEVQEIQSRESSARVRANQCYLRERSYPSELWETVLEIVLILAVPLIAFLLGSWVLIKGGRWLLAFDHLPRE